MSKETVLQFRQAVNANEQLQDAIRNAGASLDVVAFAREQGYAFTEEELQSVTEEAEDALTDFELEMVAGGGGRC